MSYDEETEYVTNYYRCIDPIENLKIRVVLKPVKNAFIPLPQFDLDKTTSSSDLSSQNDDDQSDVEEYTFKWQEKIFSKSEIKHYSNLSNCKTKLQETYHENVAEILKSSKNHQRKLFTYVDVDNYELRDSDLNAVEGRNSYISHLADRINKLDVSGGSVRNFRNISKRKIVNYSPSDDFQKQNHLINRDVQKMFIMVDLGSKYKEENMKGKDEHISHEYILCILIYDMTNKVLKMTPSFSQMESAKPYSIGVDRQDTRSAYHYWLHHVSIDIPREDLLKEKKIMNKILQHQKELRELQVGTDFAIAKPNHVYITILGEIISAEDFEYDYLSVHYFIKVPVNWGCDNTDTLLGTTHTARMNSFGVAHFSYLFQVQLMFDLRILEESPESPELFFEVLSLDKWNRYRNEGYSYITLPKSPGVHDITLTCWRAACNTRRFQLERFFIGGGPELEDISYIGALNNQKGIMSRFGFETVPSGRIKVKLNIIHQTEVLKVDRTDKGELERNVLERLDASTLLGSVNAVLEAFRRARERMLRAKEGLEPETGDITQGELEGQQEEETERSD